MAVIKSVKALEPLLPKPNHCAYESMITHTPPKVLLANIIYAVEINNKENKIDSIYRVEFSLFTAPGASYLFINRQEEDLSPNTPFIKGKNKEGIDPTIEDWGFEVDNIGLHVNAGLRGEKTIYFCTSHLDAKDIRKRLKEKIKKETLITEIVYV